MATMSRPQGSVSLSSADAEHHGTVSALAEAKQVPEILGEYLEDTHIILGTDSSAAKPNAERPGCGRMKHISVKYRYLQGAFTNQQTWLRTAWEGELVVERRERRGGGKEGEVGEGGREARGAAVTVESTHTAVVAWENVHAKVVKVVFACKGTRHSAVGNREEHLPSHFG